MRNRKLLIGAAIVVAVLVVGIGAAAFALANAPGETAAGDVQPGPGGPDATAIVMHDNAFEPAQVQVSAGGPIEFELRNDGQANHNFTSSDLGVSTGPMEPGDVSTLTVSVPTGTTQFVCTWHPGMTIGVTAS
jgi:plastocyanin